MTTAKLAQICYILVCLHVLFFGYLIVAHTRRHYWLTMEDGWIENLTAVAFLLAGIILFTAALAERRLFPRCAYILGSVGLALFAGEEISWGQRIIGFETPAFLLDLNYQKEVNFHNTYQFNAVFNEPGKILFALCIAGCAAFFCRKDRIFGTPLPSILLTLAFLVVLSFTLSRNPTGFLQLMLTWHHGTILLLLFFALFSGNARLFVAAATAMSLALVISYLSYHHLSYHNRIHTDLWELIEYLFSIIAIFYALTALLNNEAARQKIAAVTAAGLSAARLPFTHISFPTPDISHSVSLYNKIKRGYLTAWTSICALIIVGSGGLAFIAYLDIRADIAAFKETYLFAYTAEPTARSTFDVYIDERDMYYFKKPCDSADVEDPFFIGVFPENIDDLPVERRQYGFDNLDFYFESGDKTYGQIAGGECAAKIRLPAYVIASVSTGQYIVKDDGSIANTWIAEFPVGASEHSP